MVETPSFHGKIGWRRRHRFKPGQRSRMPRIWGHVAKKSTITLGQLENAIYMSECHSSFLSWAETSNTRLSSLEHFSSIPVKLSQASWDQVLCRRSEQAGKKGLEKGSRYTAGLRNGRELSTSGGHLQVPSPTPLGLIFL